MIFRIANKAREEADEAAAWYEERSAGLGDTFLASLRQCFSDIRTDPKRFSRLEYPKDIQHEVRRVVLRRFPYVVIYSIFDNQVVVMAVPHSSREPGYWIERLEDE